MILSDILNGVDVLDILGNKEIEISEIVFDSRKAVKNSLYIAIKGTLVDGHQYIPSAIEKGTKGIVCEVLPEQKEEGITYIKVENSSDVLGLLASNFYGNPSKDLILIGVTGTNGKTSISTLLFDVFQKMGYLSALISTVEYRIGSEVFPSTHTTPDIITLNRILSKAVEQGCQYAFMEVSSHGIHQGRIDGLNFRIAGFTNITHDHWIIIKLFWNILIPKNDFLMSCHKRLWLLQILMIKMVW